MKKWLLSALVGSALVLGACGGGGDDAEKGGSDNADAEAIFKANCASCHGADLSGGAGPALDKAGANHSADEIADIIENGTGNMGAQKQVSADDRATLSEWLAAKK